MQKTPTYIGIFAENPKDTANKLKNYGKECIEELMSMGINSILVQQDYNGFDANFTTPKDNYHITTLFIGNGAQKLQEHEKVGLK